MAQVKVSHYPLADIPQETLEGIAKLDSVYAERIKASQDDALVSTASSKGNIIAFCITVRTEENEANLKYIFVHPACRKNNFGSQLLITVFKQLSKQNIDFVSLQTPEPAKDFFIHNGFILIGEPSPNRRTQVYRYERPDLSFYLEQLKSSQSDPKRKRLIPLNIPSDSHHYRYKCEHDFMACQRCMISQAQREIAILCRSINNPLFKDEYIRSCFLQLSKRNAQAKIKILLENDKEGAGYHNPIIDLANKLTSFIEIRCMPNGSSKPGEMITCVDYDAGIYRKDYESYNGFANFHNHLIAQRLRDSFQQQWQFSKPSMEFRRLSL